MSLNIIQLFDLTILELHFFCHILYGIAHVYLITL